MNGENNGPAVPVPRLVKFHLPQFTANDPDTSFSAIEHIFMVNLVASVNEKFSSLLQCLDATQLGFIRVILTSVSVTKFTEAEERLVQFVGFIAIAETTGEYLTNAILRT